MIITRFAPSPTGNLHIGHAYSAIFAYNLAIKSGGKFILRIEDIDHERCNKASENGIYEDLSWLGLTWEQPVHRQSEHMDNYKQALDKLHDMSLLYPCFCSRREIREEIARAGSAPHGPEGALYPGTCKTLTNEQREEKIAAGKPYAFRLDLEKARLKVLSLQGEDLDEGELRWRDHEKGWQTATPEILGDAVLARKDIATSYHLSVVIDDHIQGVTLVTRGEELFYASHLHRLLQELLGLDVPEWQHHKFITDKDGKRLAKRDNPMTIKMLRKDEGKTPQDIMDMIDLHI